MLLLLRTLLATAPPAAPLVAADPQFNNPVAVGCDDDYTRLARRFLRRKRQLDLLLLNP